MVPIFTVSGYTASDPLDRFPRRNRVVLTMLVGAILAATMLYAANRGLRVYDLRHGWMLWAGCGAFTFLWVPVLLFLRKCSSVVILIALWLPTFLLDLYLQAHVRDRGGVAWWTYLEDSPLGQMPPLPRFALAWAIDAIIMGLLVLWIARILASRFAPKVAEPEPTPGQRAALFPREWTEELVASPTRDVAHWGLRLLGTGYILYLGFLFLGVLGRSPFPEQLRTMLEMSYENPALLINTFSKITLMAVLALTGAFNRSLRWHCALGLLVGHVVSTVASLFFYYYEPVGTEYRDFLLTSAIVDGAMILFFAWLVVRYRDSAKLGTPLKKSPEFYSLPQRITRNAFLVFGALMALEFVAVLTFRLFDPGAAGFGAVYGFPDAQVGNTVTKAATLCLLGFMMARREALREAVFGVILFPFAIQAICSSLWLIFGDASGGLLLRTRHVDSLTGVRVATAVDWYFMLSVAVDVLVLGALAGLRKMYYDVEYRIAALDPGSAQAVMSLHEALFGGKPEDHSIVLHSIDEHIAGIRGRKRGLLNAPFWVLEYILPPIYGLRPAFSTMDPEHQRSMLRRFVLRPLGERRRAWLPGLAGFVYRLGTAIHAFVTLGHYTYLRTQQAIGYVPPEARDRLQGNAPESSPPFSEAAGLPRGPDDPLNDKPLIEPLKPLVAFRVATPIGEPPVPDEVDYLVIGSGAGGAVMAYRLACAVPDPSRILVVERGPRYSPLQDFNDNEMEMIRSLYKEGGLQQTKRFDLIVLQGECVGGTTVVNNAVCFEMPRSVRDRWQSEFGLDLPTLDSEYARIADELGIHDIDALAINQRVAERFREGVAGYNAATSQEERLSLTTLKSNHRNPLGEGLCNLGNMRLRKRSMLETYIPWAEARGVKVVSETSAVRFVSEGGRATSVLLRTDMGSLIPVRVKRAVIVAGGVIASSHILMRSGVEGRVGRGMSCNFAFPLAFEYEQGIDAFDGLQITLGALDPRNRATFETYFNPPGAFSISLPFYFDRLTSTMGRYRNLLNFGAIIGSEPNGVIERKADVLNGRAFRWQLGATDVQNIKYALATLARIGLASKAKRCVIPTEPGIDLPLDPASVDRFCKELSRYPLRTEDLRLTTAHPQGGNRMMDAGSRWASERVVTEDFRVEGYENVFVADASIFPDGITVNPQWTIMALSSMASEKILERCPPTGTGALREKSNGH